MTAEKAIPAVLAYCKEQIDNFDVRADLALDRMDKERIPLESTDFRLADEVYDCLDDWCTDHECEWLYDEITMEDILFY